MTFRVPAWLVVPIEDFALIGLVLVGAFVVFCLVAGGRK